MTLAVARAAAAASFTRYRRSWGLWLILLAGPLAARYMVGRSEGEGVQIGIDGRVPILTWDVLGVWLGVVTTTLVVVAAWIYLRSSVTKVQPWQVEDVAPANRPLLALGKFAADTAMLWLALAALTIAGFILGTLWIGPPYDPVGMTIGLWVIAAPALAGIAALRQLFAARPWLRGGWGDFVFFCCWMGSLMGPIASSGKPPTFAANMSDFPGFVRPLLGNDFSTDRDFQIGGFEAKPGDKPIAVDVESNLASPGFLPSRLAWLVIAALVAATAGLIYRTRVSGRKRRFAWIAKLTDYGPPRPANPASPPAHHSALALPLLAWREARLALNGRLLAPVAVAISLLGVAGDYRHVGSGAALLLLSLVLSAQAGRDEARGMGLLTNTVPQSPWARRLAFVIGGTLLSLAMAIPAMLAQRSLDPLAIAGSLGLAVSLTAMVLAALTGGPTAPRIILLIAWYAYLSS